MILVTGGVFQGKREFALTLKKDARVVKGEQLDAENIRQADIVMDFHLYIRRLLTEGADAGKETERLLEGKKDLILTVAELGCGIVPMEAFERKYRETVGRICCNIAKEAEAVYRVNCGIGTRIK